MSSTTPSPRSWAVVDEATEGVLATTFEVDEVRVDHVVAVAGAGHGLEHGREVHV